MDNMIEDFSNSNLYHSNYLLPSMYVSIETDLLSDSEQDIVETALTTNLYECSELVKRDVRRASELFYSWARWRCSVVWWV